MVRYWLGEKNGNDKIFSKILDNCYGHPKPKNYIYIYEFESIS